MLTPSDKVQGMVHTDDLLPSTVARSFGFSALAMELLASVVQNDTSSDEREDSRRPCAIPCHPILHPVREALRPAPRAHSGWPNSRWKPCLLR